ncbi:MAG: cell division protein ZapA [Pseudomonadota bacterium]
MTAQARTSEDRAAPIGVVKGPGEVELSLGGERQRVACAPGEEARLIASAELVHDQIKRLQSQALGVPTHRLMLMAALSLADDLSETRGRLATTENALAQTTDRAAQEAAQFEDQMAEMLTRAAARLEQIAEDLRSPEAAPANAAETEGEAASEA